VQRRVYNFALFKKHRISFPIDNMADELFIKAILQKGNEARQKVQSEFSNLSLQQLNWKASPESWSIAQCLNHLVVSDSSYFSTLDKITDGSYQASFWRKYSPFSKVFGRVLKDQLREQVGRKLKAPKKFLPAASEFSMEILERYYKNLDDFSGLIARCRNIDLDKTVITSPAVSFVTYSLRDAMQFLMQHEHRHINQAARIKMNENFPK